jgi:hypothetical protein
MEATTEFHAQSEGLSGSRVNWPMNDSNTERPIFSAGVLGHLILKGHNAHFVRAICLALVLLISSCLWLYLFR